MKAAVLHEFGETPRYEDFPDPIPDENEIVINVKAVALENVDQLMAAGEHFASKQFLTTFPAIVGFDGIGKLTNGKLVGFSGMKTPYGAMAEKVVVPETHTIPIPEGVDASVAAALPATALTTLFPLQWGANLQKGETVLINGATGVAGKLAIQIAKLLGAGRVIGTGRNEKNLKSIMDFGADAVIDLKQSDETLVETFNQEAGDGYDIIIDFLWGHPTEVLIQTLIPKKIGHVNNRIRLVQVGSAAGETISLPASSLRNSGLEIIGASKGLTSEAMAKSTEQIWDWIAKDKLNMDIEKVPLKSIEAAWNRQDFQGKRIVIVP